MDKLELDTRVARLERRYSLLVTVLSLAIVVAVFLIFLGRGGRDVHLPAAVATPLPTPAPNPNAYVPSPAMDPAMGDMGMWAAPVSLDMFSQELAMLKQLKEEGFISEPEWQAKKAQVLGKGLNLNAGDLRSDLQKVQQLFDSGAIGEEERSALRARLLGIGGPAEGMQDH